ncbi:restriction endonuclease subunit S [Tissierella sp. P1]|uniref:restriction endonuclease subunit S n=1 Tax=Tissierella sp. P1 TaxID=1280483 RepID=UPI00191290E2|nr:restriction endonuclease subunit S [Tissierella sp. P1]
MGVVSREWEEVRLGDVIDFNPTETIKKGTISKKIGMEMLNSFQRKIEGFEVTEYKSGTKFRNGDTLLARITPCLENGKTAQVTILDGNEIGFGSTEFIVLRQKPKHTVNDFIYYLAISPMIRETAIKSMTGTSGRQRAQKDVIENTLFKLPTLKEQKAIAYVLSTLDEKIEVNKQINKKLEEMAQTIFKHWFIDFEFPNENEEPYKSSGGEMVESELGMIPKGWEVGTIQELGDVVGGATPSKKKEEYFVEKGIPWVTPKDLSENKNLFISRGALDITEEAYKSTSVRKMPKGTVLFSSRAPIGYIAISKNEITTNQGFKSIVPRISKGFSSEFIYCWLRENIEVIKNRASGSTFKEISGGEMNKIPSIIPEKSILDKFKNIISNAFIKIEVRESENQVLSGLRDTLLPKLMSGEIRVPLEEDEIL